MPKAPNGSPRDAAEAGQPPPDDLSGRLERLTAAFAEAAAVAGEVLASLHEGRRPGDRQLELLHRTAAEFDGVVRAVMALDASGSAPPEDLGGISALLEGVAEREALCRRFTGSELPEHLAEVVRPVLAAARDGEGTEHLAALAALADAVAEDA